MAKIRHHHLSEGERHRIYALREQELLIWAIAIQLERLASTISRELRRSKRSNGAYVDIQMDCGHLMRLKVATRAALFGAHSWVSCLGM